ncbi:MAG: 3-deoxy-D-manno-octulosonic acid transferase, partial [Rhodospirillales bacterium 20-64-7]
DAAALAAFRAALPGAHWLAASTHAGEEAPVIAAHRALLGEFPELVTVIAPRHPERGGAVAALAGAAPRRSAGEMPVPGLPFIADTLGELGLFYRAAPFAFIGNSLAGFGGHNLIEPARLGRAVLSGPHTENFAQAAAALGAAQALVTVTDADSLAAAVHAWLASPETAAEAGARAAAAFQATGDLPDRLATLILDCALQ